MEHQSTKKFYKGDTKLSTILWVASYKEGLHKGKGMKSIIIFTSWWILPEIEYHLSQIIFLCTPVRGL